MMSQALGLSAKSDLVPVSFQTTAEGVTLTASNKTGAVRRLFPGAGAEEPFAIPLAALAECEGRSDDLVTFRRDGDLVGVEWRDEGIPLASWHDVLATPANFADAGVLAEDDPALTRALAEGLRDSLRESLVCTRKLIAALRR